MATEKLTVNRIGEEKVMSGTSQRTGKPYSFRKVGIQVNEYPDRWMDFNFNERNPLIIGQQYEFETSSREYNGQTYWSASFPKRPAAGGISPEQYETLLREVRAVNANVLRLIGMMVPKPPSPPGFDPAAIDAAFDIAYADNHPEAPEEPSLESLDDPAKQ